MDYNKLPTIGKWNLEYLYFIWKKYHSICRQTFDCILNLHEAWLKHMLQVGSN